MPWGGHVCHMVVGGLFGLQGFAWGIMWEGGLQ